MYDVWQHYQMVKYEPTDGRRFRFSTNSQRIWRSAPRGIPGTVERADSGDSKGVSRRRLPESYLFRLEV